MNSSQDRPTTAQIINEVIRDSSPAILPWEAVSIALGMQGFSISADSLSAGLPALNSVPPELVMRALRDNGCIAELRTYPIRKISQLVCPALLWTKQGGLVVLVEASDGKHAKLIMPDLGRNVVQVNVEELQNLYGGICVLFKAKSQVQSREPDWMSNAKEHWLWKVLWQNRLTYIEVAVATFLINILALAGTFFTMTVYDRVIPNNAFSTLWVLAIGVLIVQAFEFIARMLRAHMLDEAGKKTDLILGMRIFSHALATRLENAPQSSGTYANMLREYETVRDFFTSLTLTLIADLPFVILFIFVMFMIAPPLALVPLAAVPLMLLLAVFAQWPLAKLMRKRFGDSSQRQGMLVEALENLETVKATRAEGYLQGLWESMSASLAHMSKKMTMLNNWVNNWGNFVQQSASVVLLIVGTYLISAGSMTQGALVGCMILIGRTLAPLNTIVALGLRVQQVRVAMTTIDHIMAAPIDRPDRPISIDNPKGQIELRDVSYAYAEGLPLAIKNVSLIIKPGEKVLILGRVGSGKSTLLRLMAGSYRPSEGLALLDGINIAQIDPISARRAIGFGTQDARLFFGTLADNVRLNRPDVTEEDMLQALSTVQLLQMINQHPMGLGMPVGEHGRNLSGGQRQLVAMARTLATKPKVLLLDEPTSAMDDATEHMLLRTLTTDIRNMTMIITTHRHSLLSIATRVIVIDAGKVVLDAPKDQALEILKKGLTVSSKANPGGSAPSASPQTPNVTSIPNQAKNINDTQGAK